MKKIICYIGIAVGILSIILGFDAMSGYTSLSFEYPGRESYGGDAYTGIQNAAADTALNVKEVGKGIEAMYEQVSFVGGAILFVAGAVICLIYFKQLIEAKEAEAKESESPNAFSPDVDCTEVRCDVCNNPVSSGDDFCNICGNRLNTVKEQESVNENEHAEM